MQFLPFCVGMLLFHCGEGSQWIRTSMSGMDQTLLSLIDQERMDYLSTIAARLDSHRLSFVDFDPDPSANQTGSAGHTLLNTPNKEHEQMNDLSQFWLPTLAILAIAFEAFHMKWSEVDWTLQDAAGDGPEGAMAEHVETSLAGLTVKLLRRATSLAKIYFVGAGKVKGRAYMVMLLCHNFFGQYLSLVNFDYMSRFWNFCQHPSQAVFMALMGNWFVLYGSMCLTAVYSRYIESMLMIHWKDHMTRYFQRIWVPHSYAFKMKDDRRLDNPDQRIQEDIGHFVASSYDLTFGLLDAIIQLGIYSFMLVKVQPKSAFPGLLFGIALTYTVLGSVVVHWIGKDLAILSWQGERYGGHFRAELRRVHDQGETVAALRSHDAELTRLQSRFEDLKLNKWKGMILKKKLGWFDRIYDPFKSVLFVCVLMPFFIKGEVSLGTVKQCEMALSRITASLSFFIHEYKQLASYRAQVDRLYDFRCCGLAFMKDKQAGKPPGTSESADVPDAQADRELHQVLERGAPSITRELAEVLELKRATLSLPSGETLLDVDFRVTRGTSILLCGAEGSGKSTLLRALAGIWPFVRLTEPPSMALTLDDCILIPQKPKLPAPMTIRQALTFPKAPENFSDELISDVLLKVRLPELLLLDLDEPLDVNGALSGGQFQKLMVAHCLLAKPAFILLDESMAHLSRENQLHLYGLLTSDLVAPGISGMVSTCHNVQDLASFHQVHYRITRKDSVHCDSTGSTDGIGGASHTLELLEPGELLKDVKEEDFQRRLIEQDEEIAMLRQALQRLQDGRAE